MDTFWIVITDCLVKNKLKSVRFFPEVFLLASISLEIVLKILFLTFSKANIWFAEQELVWGTYLAIETLLMTKMEIIDKREFVAVVLNINNKTFIIYVAALVKSTTILIYFFYQAQVALLTSKKPEFLLNIPTFATSFLQTLEQIY